MRHIAARRVQTPIDARATLSALSAQHGRLHLRKQRHVGRSELESLHLLPSEPAYVTMLARLHRSADDAGDEHLERDRWKHRDPQRLIYFDMQAELLPNFANQGLATLLPWLHLSPGELPKQRKTHRLAALGNQTSIGPQDRSTDDLE